LDSRLCGAVKSETREDQFVVPASKRNSYAVFDLHRRHRTVLRSEGNGNPALSSVIYPTSFGVKDFTFKRFKCRKFHSLVIRKTNTVMS